MFQSSKDAPLDVGAIVIRCGNTDKEDIKTVLCAVHALYRVLDSHTAYLHQHISVISLFQMSTEMHLQDCLLDG